MGEQTFIDPLPQAPLFCLAFAQTVLLVQQSYVSNVVIIPLLQIRKLRPRDLCAQGYAAVSGGLVFEQVCWIPNTSSFEKLSFIEMKRLA